MKRAGEHRVLVALVLSTLMLHCLAEAARFRPIPGGLRSGPLARIERMIVTGQLNQAEQELIQLTNSGLCHGEALALYGRLKAIREDLPGAIAFYRQALDCKHRARGMLLELATAYDVTGKLSEAVQVYRLYLKDYPDDVEFLHELGLTEIMRGRPPHAVEALAHALRLAANNPQLAADLGYALTLAGRLEDALQAYSLAIKLRPINRRARLKRAELLLARGRWQGALADFRAVLRQHAGDQRALYGELRCLLHNFAPNAKTTEQRSAQVSTRLDQAAARLGQIEQAGALNAGLVSLLKGQLLRRQGKLKQARTLLEVVVSQAPDTGPAWQELLLIAVHTRDTKLRQRASMHLKRLGL